MRSDRRCPKQSPMVIALASVWACEAPALTAALLIGWMLAAPWAHAASALPAGTLPVPAANFVASGTVGHQVNGSNLTVNQASNRAVLNWQSFNIARDAAVRFNQPGASAATLNRIHDANPSVIQGQLKANGQVYLYNRNGILFDRGAQVNVNTLVATTLDITDDVFNRGLLSRERADQEIAAWNGDSTDFGKSFVRVENGAEIRTETNGRVLLFAPRVENNGTIATPEGQTVMAAGAKVYLAASTDTRLRGFLVEVDPAADGTGGRVTNEALGRIVAERGNATLVGLAVNQSGRVSATTSASLNGSIVLSARDTAALTQSGLSASRGGTAVLGPGSVTEILPDTADKRTIQDSQPFLRSRVAVAGEKIHLQRDAQIVAPGGDVALTAQRALDFQAPGEAARDGVRIQLEAGSRIDVAGLRNVAVPIERNIIQIDLRGNELKDAPLQRDGPLRNQTVSIDVRKGTPLTDISGLAAQIPRTTEERLTEGGSVTLRSEGDVVLRAGSSVDVSGGSIRYTDGYLATSKLYTADNRIVDIGSASPDWLYLGVADAFTARSEKFGVVQTERALRQGEYTAGYEQGANAGTVTLTGHRVVADAQFKAGTVIGPLQREQKSRPLGGLFVLGDPSDQPTPADYRASSVRFVASRELLPGDLAIDQSLPLAWSERVDLPTSLAREDGFSRIAIYSNEEFTLPTGESLVLAPWGSLNVNARSIVIDGTVTSPFGTIDLRTRLTSARDGGGTTAQDHLLRIGDGAVLSTAGSWVNDSPRSGAGVTSSPLALNGGVIRLASQADARLEAGALLDVSGGAHVSAAEKLTYGNGGSITISTGRFGLGDTDPQTSVLTLDAQLRGFAAGRGGSLTLAVSRVRIGGAADANRPQELYVDPALFQSSGFARFTLSGQDGVVVAADTQVAAFASSWVLDGGYAVQPSGTPIARIARPQFVPAPRGGATEVALSTGSRLRGDLAVEPRASIVVDGRGKITLTSARQLTVDGALTAPAGEITLTVLQPGANDSFLADQSLWLGSNSRISATGMLSPEFRRDGLLRGEVLNGGKVTLNAASGYLVMQSGAVVDVSGTAALLDLPTSNGAAAFARNVVGSGAGSIVVSAREGMLLEGDLIGRPGADGQAGGTLNVALERATLPLAYPVQPDRILTLRQDLFALPAGLAPGADVPGEFNGRAPLGASAIESGGFHRVLLGAEHRVEFDGTVSLRTARSIEIDAPAIALVGDGQATLATGYLALGNLQANRPAPLAPAAGDGRLSASANHIELRGTFAMPGLAEAVLTSSRDIQLTGILPTPQATRPVGAIRIGGDLTLQARQIYPVTRTEFGVHVLGPGHTLRVLPSAAPAPVYSADGILALHAANIVVSGTVKVPFGELRVEAADRLEVTSGGLLSVSAEGLVIPYGATELAGRRYVYPLSVDNRVILSRPGEKRIALKGDVVELAPGSRIDLNGGGELLAAEFVPGTGGSRDVLDPANAVGTYAILPALKSAYGPADPFYGLNVAGLLPGDAVTLTGVPGLADGTYALLPARYALLPGAFLVTAVANTLDMLPAQSYTKADGSVVVPGVRAAAGMGGWSAQDARTSGFNVRPGASARRQSEYLETTATQFFAAASSRRPADAGVFSVEAGDRLRLDGLVTTMPGSGGRGAAVDIAAPRIQVTATAEQPVEAGFVALPASALNALEAESLLLGGVRGAEVDGVRVDVKSEAVILANDRDSVLLGPELMLAATDVVSARPGAAMLAEGRAPGDPAPILIGRDGAESGDGAFVRVAAGAQADLRRVNVTRSRGVVDFSSESFVGTSGAARFDATLDTRVGAGLDLGASATLALGGGRISIGDTERVVEGLRLSSAQVRSLDALKEISLLSYSSVDFHGDVVFGSATLGSLRIEAGAIAGYGDGPTNVRVQADRVLLGGGAGLAYSPAPALSDGSVPRESAGALDIVGRSVQLTGGDFVLRGFEESRISATQDFSVAGSGRLHAADRLAITASRVVPRTGAVFDVVADGTLTIASVPGSPSATIPMDPGLGARLGFSGQSIRVAAPVLAPSGEIRMSATGSTSADGVIIDAGAVLSTAGVSIPFIDTRAVASGGRIELGAVAGNVELKAGAMLDVSAPLGGDAGSIAISAPAGTFSSAATLIGGSGGSSGAAPAWQSSFSVDAARVSAFSALQRALDARTDGSVGPASHGFLRERVFRVREDDVVLDADATVHAQRVALAADQGSILVEGRVDASAPNGGSIEMHAGAGGVMHLGSNAVLDAHATTEASDLSGTQGRGGRVTLGAGVGGRIVVASGARVDVSGADGAQAGKLAMRAPRSGNDIAIDTFGAQVVGADEVGIEAYRVYDRVGTAAISSLGSTAATGRLTFNQINSDNTAYLSSTNAAAMRSRLGLIDTDSMRFLLRAGVEVRAANNLTLASDWDLRTARPGGVPGVLTLRAGGNLLLNSSLSDGFSNATANGVLQSGASWSYRLVAGADLAAADPLAVIAGRGDLEVAPRRIVRTGTGSIDLAAGRDILLRYSVRDAGGSSFVLDSEPGVVYTAGSAGPALANFPGITINNLAATFPSGGGDLTLRAGRDIATRSTSSNDIDTAPITQFYTDWLYRQGSLAADGTTGSFAAPRTAWWTRFSDFRQGFGALGGGNVDVRATRDIDGVGFSLPTNGRLVAPNNSLPEPGNLVVQGGGDLVVIAGGDIDSSSFLLGDGSGRIEAGDAIGSSRLTALERRPLYSSVALGEGRVTMRSRTDLVLETVASPTVIEQVAANFAGSGGNNRRSYFFGYGDESSLALGSAAGSITLLNEPIGLGQFVSRLANGQDGLFVYPARVRAEAPSGSLRIGGSFELYPSSSGSLDLLAGESIVFEGRVGMIDAPQDRLPSAVAPDRNTERLRLQASGLSPTGIDAHSSPPLHLANADPVRIIALQGDIVGPVTFDPQGLPSVATMAILPKPLLLSAGGNVRDAWIFGQNLRDDDVSHVVAGGDLAYSTVGGSGSRARLEWGGPGRLEVAVGGSIDLGDSVGIVTRGNLNNPALAEQGASVVLSTGAAPVDYASFVDRALARPSGSGRLDLMPALIAFVRERTGDSSLDGDVALSVFRRLPAQTQSLFVREVFFGALKQTGRTAPTISGGIERYELGYNAIADLYPRTNGRTYSGDINLFFSQIKTEQGGDIELLVPGGVVNAGLASVDGGGKSDAQLGIVTVRGGSIRAMASGDFFVNQSRVFTLQGGDILIWSSNGNIDAGRGAKSASATPPPQIITRGDQIVLDITNSISGSGIGVLLAKADIVPGDVDLIAPRGEINAGEAPIRAAGNINIAAERVVGADNIQVGGAATGVSLQAAPSISAGIASTGSSVAEASRSAEQATRATASTTTAALGDQVRIRPTFLTVEVLGFGDEAPQKSPDERRPR